MFIQIRNQLVNILKHVSSDVFEDALVVTVWKEEIEWSEAVEETSYATLEMIMLSHPFEGSLLVLTPQVLEKSRETRM